jgi:hypothetical protein
VNNKKTVMLVDDAPVANHLHQHLLLDSGLALEVMTFLDAAKALKALVEETTKRNTGRPWQLPDIILLDLKMPGMEGFDSWTCSISSAPCPGRASASGLHLGAPLGPQAGEQLPCGGPYNQAPDENRAAAHPWGRRAATAVQPLTQSKWRFNEKDFDC